MAESDHQLVVAEEASHQLAVVEPVPEPAIVNSSSSSSSSSSNSSSPSRPRPVRKRRRRETEEKARRLHHIVFAAPRDREGSMVLPENLGKAGFAKLLQEVTDQHFGDRNKVIKFSIFEERHADNSVHLHCAMLCDRPCVSGPLVRLFKEKKVYTYFESSATEYYFSLIVYLSIPSATKPACDPAPFLSEGHPTILETLQEPPRGANRTDKERAKAFLGKKGVNSSVQRAMDHVEFAKFAIANKLRSKTSLLAYLKKNHSDETVKAAEQYCFRFSSQLESRLSFAWEWEDAPQKEQADNTSAWDMVLEAANHDCICDGKFTELLESNLHFQCNGFPAFMNQEEKPTPECFREAMVRSLQVGARKLTNLFLFGPRNSGKSSALAALEAIFGPKFCFSRPAGKSGFLMQGILHKKVCILQDLRPNTLRISWDSMLVWLEGAPLTVALPRNSFAEDVLYTDAAPVFISAAEKFRISTDVCIKENIQDPQVQNDMMDSRFRFFAFPRSRPSKDLIVCSPCVCCFSRWLQVGRNVPRAMSSVGEEVAEPPRAMSSAGEEVAEPQPSASDTAVAEEVCGMEEDWPTPFDFDEPEELLSDYPYYEDCLEREEAA